jgi:hypothetical protein
VYTHTHTHTHTHTQVSQTQTQNWVDRVQQLFDLINATKFQIINDSNEKEKEFLTCALIHLLKWRIFGQPMMLSLRRAKKTPHNKSSQEAPTESPKVPCCGAQSQGAAVLLAGTLKIATAYKPGCSSQSRTIKLRNRLLMQER